MNMNVSLTEELARFIKEKVEAGRYASSSEVVRDALRLMEKRELHEAEELQRLRRAWKEGEASGDFRPLEIEAIKSAGRKRLKAVKA